jgi:hypothetical protein
MCEVGKMKREMSWRVSKERSDAVVVFITHP